jgi:hypothetical protein
MHKYIVITLVLLGSFNIHAQTKTQANWQQQVDYTIDVKLDDVNHYLNAVIGIEYTNNSPSTLNFIYFHIWPNAYKNRNTAFAKQMEQNKELDFYFSKPEEKGFLDSLSFTSNGKPLTIEQTENIDVIKVVLNAPLKSGESVTLSTPFRVKVPKVYSRLGHQGQDYFITQWYPKPAVYDVNGWNQMPYLNQGEFYSEFGSFKVNISLPSNYVVVATGECANANEFDAKGNPGLGDEVPPSATTFKTVRFTADNVHDFAWFASKRFGYLSKTVKIGDREVIARVVASKPDKGDLAHIETALTYYSENVGEYPYSHATAVHGELKAGGGMEYPMITICDQMGEEVIIHEVGHNWFYGILASNERAYPWMDESINSFYEGKAMHNGELKEGINELLMNALAKDELLRNEYQAAALNSEVYTGTNYGVSVYGLGAKSFHHLEGYLGEELFKQCMTTYFDEWKFKHPLPDDMKNSFEKTSGIDLDWFFDDLLNENKKLDYGVKKKNGEFYLVNNGFVDAPMPIAFMQNGKPTITWQTAPIGGEMQLVKPIGPIENILIDAEKITNDVFPNNDASKNKIKLKLGTGRDKKGINEIYWLPAYAWNVYDKSMLGLVLHNYAISNKAFQYHIVPLYSFENKSINGLADINYTFTGEGLAQNTQLGVKAMSFSFEERNFGRAEYSYLKVSPYLTYNFAKSSLRNPIEKSLKLQYDHIFLSPNFEFNDDTLSGPKTYRANTRNFATLTYELKNKRAINGYGLQLMAEYGSINNKVINGDTANKQVHYYVEDSAGNKSPRYYFPNIGEEIESNNFLRLSGVYTYNLDIGIDDKPLELRVYGSYLLKAYANSQYKNSVGSIDGAGYYDYRFDDVLMHRNADYGMFRNQVSNRRDFSKFVGSIAQSDKWLISANATLPLPGKFPVKPYLEVLMFNDIDQVSYNTNGAKFFYNIGLEIEVIPNRFEIFLNLAQSKEVTAWQENSSSSIDNFLERITFVFDLNNLTPPKIKKSVKLF